MFLLYLTNHLHGIAIPSHMPSPHRDLFGTYARGIDLFVSHRDLFATSRAIFHRSHSQRHTRSRINIILPRFPLICHPHIETYSAHAPLEAVIFSFISYPVLRHERCSTKLLMTLVRAEPGSFTHHIGCCCCH